MSQLQTITNTIPASFEGMTKTDLTTRAMLAVEYILENGGALQAAEILSSMEFFIKEMKKQEAFSDYVRQEVEKYNGRFTSISGAKIEKVEAGVSYDYSNDSKWQELNKTAEEAIEARKKHEEALRRISPGKLLVDESTGEVFTGPSKKSTSTYKITLAK